ncbi:MAG: AarF/ABC1/UbiB kinase family protein [Bacilli bacterium]|nr:AarF/ABC1/UbiB kinase family protein [Bacilli bacterium]
MGKFIFSKNSGEVIKDFSSNMGIVYIKLAQILSTLNIGDYFTEEDRIKLSSICDNCKPISFRKIKKILRKEYGGNLNKIFKYIDKKPIGSASISQVHKCILFNGEEVAIKIKREDITYGMERDILKLKKLIHRYGKLFHFGNFKGAYKSLDLYLSWIMDEINFDKERENIKKYSKYLESVNVKVDGCLKLKCPKVYDEYSTSNIIVMEYVKHATINKMELNDSNKEKIVNALNSYIKCNFYAMFNDLPIAFHGDPHSGNLAIDDDGNLWFLDMGLLFILSSEESKLCREFFLTIYMGNYEKLYDMLIIYGNLSNAQKIKFKEDIKKYIDDVRNKNVTHYFIDLIGVCLKFEFVPPSFLFNMGKAFICVYGISNFSLNKVGARELLKDQVFLYMIKKGINNFFGVINKLDENIQESVCKCLDDFKEFVTIINN